MHPRLDCFRELGTNAFSAKLSNGTIPKGLGKETDIRVENISQERKDVLEKQHSCEEANLLVSDFFFLRTFIF